VRKVVQNNKKRLALPQLCKHQLSRHQNDGVFAFALFLLAVADFFLNVKPLFLFKVLGQDPQDLKKELYDPVRLKIDDVFFQNQRPSLENKVHRPFLVYRFTKPGDVFFYPLI
jgi:hypothetical protein